MTNQTLYYLIAAIAVVVILTLILVISRKGKGKSEQSADSNKQIYVGNLPYRARENDLKRFFSKFGTISQVRIVKNRNTGKSMGFGFVTFSKSSQAKSALAVHGEDFQGRSLVVRIAKPR